jgi:arabinan endo-1,5-alpha-L-arabinosidase
MHHIFFPPRLQFVALFGVNTSGIGLATNRALESKSPDYKWVDCGLVLESKAEDDFNSIDPNYIEDAQHHAWLSFGSFWAGIKVRALDVATGILPNSESALLVGVTSETRTPCAAEIRSGAPNIASRLAGL